MPSTTLDTDVLIVGAGPVGLFLANECARRGLRYRIVEARATQSEHSKALAIFPRTMEIFDMAGIVDPFLEQANRVTSVRIVAHGKTLAHMQFTPEQSPYQFVAMVPQNITERLLVEELVRKGGTVEYETTFVSAAESDDHVSVTLAHNDHPLKLTAAFVVGCDGQHSAVRHLLKPPFAGAEYTIRSYWPTSRQTTRCQPTNPTMPKRSRASCHLSNERYRRRIIVSIKVIEGDVPSLELIQKILSERAPVALKRGAALEQLLSYSSSSGGATACRSLLHRWRRGSYSQPIWRTRNEHGLHDVWNGVETRSGCAWSWQRTIAGQLQR